MIDQSKIKSGQLLTFSNKLWLVLTVNMRTSKSAQVRVWCPQNNNITDLNFPDPGNIVVVSEPMFTKEFCKGLLDVDKMAPETLSLEKLFEEDDYISKKQLIKEYTKLLQYNEVLLERMSKFNLLFSNQGQEEKKEALSVKERTDAAIRAHAAGLYVGGSPTALSITSSDPWTTGTRQVYESADAPLVPEFR